MQITIGDYRIRRYDNLNLCVEQRKLNKKQKILMEGTAKRMARQSYKIIHAIK